MPELPEVETVRRGLSGVVQGHTIASVEVRDARLRWPVPASLDERLAGRRLHAIGRRAKYLLFDFGEGTLIVHLGMSGNLVFRAATEAPGAHDHADFRFDNGVLRYRDPRRFGAILWHGREAGPVLGHPRLRGLGPEPLDDSFDGGVLHRASRGRRVSVKQWLLAGEAVVGVGNIYASESLHRAGIRPTRRAGSLGTAACDRLAAAIRATLAAAIAAGGTTLRDFASHDGQGGYFQLDCRVYDRAGQSCPGCGAPVRRIVQQARASYYCASCQH